MLYETRTVSYVGNLVPNTAAQNAVIGISSVGLIM